MTEEFYKGIWFNRSQVEWVLRNWLFFMLDIWPDDPENSRYWEPPRITSTKGKSKPPIFNAGMVRMEINVRLDKCGFDGLLVKPYYCLGESAERLARLAHCAPDQLERRMNKVVEYISNKWPKDRSYYEFLRHGKGIRNEGILSR